MELQTIDCVGGSGKLMDLLPEVQVINPDFAVLATCAGLRG